MPFRYPACLVLDRLAGQLTAVIAISEVAALELLSSAEQSGDKDVYISHRCKAHHVLVTGSYVPLFRERRLRYYLAQTYELTEVFYREFKANFEEFFGPASWMVQAKEERSKDGDESQLVEILRNTPDGQRLKNHPYFVTIEYYRVMRNCIVHAIPDSESKRKTHKDLGKLKTRLAELYEEETPKAFHFEAPNEIENLQLDDIRLFSRCLQRLARMVSDRAMPNGQALIDAAFGGAGGQSFLRSYKRKVAGCPPSGDQSEKMVKLIQYRLMDRFGLTRNETLTILQGVTLPSV
jgi:hypothetical protein